MMVAKLAKNYKTTYPKIQSLTVSEQLLCIRLLYIMSTGNTHVRTQRLLALERMRNTMKKVNMKRIPINEIRKK